MRQYYTQTFITNLFEEWNQRQQSDFPPSMRQFCLDWAVPRSTFQGWLKKQAVAALPADRFYSAPNSEAKTVVKFESGIDAHTADVLRLLANELKAVVTDITEILDRL